jgi:four helix bundle protein
MESSYHSFEDLQIWQEGMELCNEIYAAMRKCRDFGLKDQMQRSVVSVPSNIAEGFELGTNLAFIRHLHIAKGSGGELRTQIYIAIKQQYIPDDIGMNLVAKAKKLNGMLQNFIAARKKQTRKRID